MWVLQMPKDLTHWIRMLAFKHDRNQRDAALLVIKAGIEIAELQSRGAKIVIQYPDRNVGEIFNPIFKDTEKE